MFNKCLNNNLDGIVKYSTLLSLFLFFKDTIESFFTKIGGIIDYNQWTFKVGFIIIVLGVCVVYATLIEKQYIVNRNITFVLIVVISFYTISRIATGTIEFYPFNSNIKYLDFLFFVALFHYVLLFRSNLKKTDYEPSNNSPFFLEDKLYIDSEIDNEKILQKLIKSIIGFKPEIAFNIGVNAVWGYGKSSFLKRFHNEYVLQSNNTIIFWCHIWKNKGSVAIIENFFDELKLALKPHSGEIASDINNYVDAILSLSNSDLNRLITSGKSFLKEDKTLEQYYKHINANINKIDKQVVILLDDLDRLEKEEILSTLKLIRTLSDFNNVIFIAGYDRKYIVESIDKPKDNYLDKIFNVEINLLPFNENLIVEELIRQIDSLYPLRGNITEEKGFNVAFKDLFQEKPLDLSTFSGDNLLKAVIEENNFRCTDKQLRYQDFLATYRDVKRFINEFRFNASFLNSQNDIICEEYILLKLLTYKYRELQNLLFTNPKNIFKTGVIDNENNKTQFLGSSSYDNVYEYDNDVKNRVIALLETSYSKEDIELINAVLCRLFGKKTTSFYNRNQNAISKIYYTDLYIKNNILGGNVSISELQKALKEAKIFDFAKELSKSVAQSRFQITNELKQFIFNNSAANKEQFIDSLKALNYIMPDSLYQDNKKVLDIINTAFSTFYSNDKSAFLDDINFILKNNIIGTIDKLLSELNIDFKRSSSVADYGSSPNRYINSVFTEDDIVKLLTAKVEYLIANNEKPELIFDAYNLLIEIIVIDKKVIMPAKLNSIMRKDIGNRFTKYFKSSVFKTITEPIDANTGEFVGYSPHFVLAQIFSDSKALNDLKENPSDIERYNHFYLTGWVMFNMFLEKKNAIHVSPQGDSLNKLNKAKQFVKAFVGNKFKPLNKEQYNEIWNDDIIL